jgi:hypothetical protein
VKALAPKSFLWILAFWAPVLGIAWLHRLPSVGTDKIEEHQRCIKTMRTSIPSWPREAQERADEILAQCLTDE